MREKESKFQSQEAKETQEGEDKIFEETMARAKKILEQLTEAWKTVDKPASVGKIKEKHDFYLNLMRYTRQNKERLAEDGGALDKVAYKNALKMLQGFTEEMDSFLDRLEENKAT